ncbi:MAG: hypothetical protein KGQ66_16965 [Acidobacteriota bacterium]|nr:hypothetical protein [Acidobacteriota bacterium]
MKRPSTTAVRLLGTLRLAWAAALLAAPARAIRLLGGVPDHQSLTVARVLGGRHALQGLVETAGGTNLGRIGAATDCLHGLSGVGLAAVDRRWRRPALSDAALAFGLAVVGRRLDR